MQKSLLLLLIITPSFLFAKSPSLFDQAIKKYQKSKMVSMNVEKTVTSEMLAKETTYSGKIKLSNGKFRWENESPEKTLLLFDGKNLFSVQYPSKEFNTGTQVAKSKIDEKGKKQILISSLLSPSNANSKFKMLSEKKGTNLTEVEIQPDSSDLQVKNLILSIDQKTKQIQNISYKDDVGNLTKMSFSNIKFEYE